MKKPNLDVSKTLGRGLAELAIIVAGVLIALGAQSWWEGRGEEEERDEAIAAVLRDSESLYRTMVNQAYESDELIRQLRLARSDSIMRGVLPDSVRRGTLLNAFFELEYVDPFLPAWDDLINSGRTELIPVNARRALTTIRQFADAARVEADIQIQFQANEIESFLVESVDIDEVFESDGSFPDEFLRQRAVQNRLSLKESQVGWSRRYAVNIAISTRLIPLALEGLPVEVLQQDSLYARIGSEIEAGVDSIRAARSGN